MPALLLIWFLAYVLPMAVGFAIVKLSPRRSAGPVSYAMFVMHIALLVSIAASQYVIVSSGHRFPWNLDSSFLFYIASVLVVFWILGPLGLGYGLSALMQQATMLSMSFILSPAFPLWVVILLIVPIYTIAHRLRIQYRLRIMSIFFLWGTASILIFSFFPSVWLVVALHTIFGAVLIKRSVLYPDLLLHR